MKLRHGEEYADPQKVREIKESNKQGVCTTCVAARLVAVPFLSVHIHMYIVLLNIIQLDITVWQICVSKQAQ